MGKIREYFVEQGLTVADIPLAIVLHEVVSIGFAMATWTACYHLRPARTLVRLAPKRASPQWLSKGYKSAQGMADRQIEKWAWLKKVPGSDPQRLTTSLTESLCFRGAIKPITIPGKLWASWKLVLMVKGRKAIIETAAKTAATKHQR